MKLNLFQKTERNKSDNYDGYFQQKWRETIGRWTSRWRSNVDSLSHPSSFIPFSRKRGFGLEKESQNLSSDVFPPRLLVIHDPGWRRHHDETELKDGENVNYVWVTKRWKKTSLNFVNQTNFWTSYLTGWEQIRGPFFDLVDGNVESGGNDAALVQPSGEIDDDFACGKMK